MIAQNGEGNGQSSSTKMGRHPYIVVVDHEDEIVLIIKHALELDKNEQFTNDSLLEEPGVADKIRRLFDKLSRANECDAVSMTPLSPRQKQVLNEIAKGHPNKGIACSLGVSQQSVKNHVHAILEKLGANNRTQAVVLAMLNGLLKIEDFSEVQSPEPTLSPAKS